MKEIDFDELDRAVNSLMNDVPKSEPVKSDDVRTVTLKTDDAQAVPPRPAASEPAAHTSRPAEDASSAGEEIAVKSRPVVTPPAARRGRFMDVVRPSVKEARKPFPSSAVSRQGATIQPVIMPPRQAATAASADGSAPMESSVPSRQDTFPSDPMISDTSVSSEVVNAPAEPEEVGTNSAAMATEPAPLTSPFLPDAKVEKRPLGRAAETMDFSASSMASFSELEETTAVQPEREDRISPNRDAQVPEQPLPAELSNELLSVETQAATATETIRTIPRSDQAARQESSFAGVDHSSATASIPQQYKTAQVTTEAPTGAIYDTATYHQPLTHPAKKTPSWLIIVAIIGVLLLGAGAGAAAYYFKLF